MNRVLSVQDLSCLGKCSLTVALPVLSGMGCAATALPTTLLSTHIIHDIESICPNLCVLDKGNMMYAGATADMIAMVEGNVWQTVCDPGEEQKLKENVTVVSVKYTAGIPTVRYIAKQSVQEDSAQVKATLEDAYIYSLGGLKR